MTAAGSFIATSAARAVLAPSSTVSRSTSQSGYDNATASSSGSGNGRGRRVSARRLAFTKPRARGERAPTASTVDATAACGGVSWSSWYAPSRNAARTGGIEAVQRSLDHVPEQVVETTLRSARCRR